MIPSLALQSAIRAKLITDPDIALHVSPDRIRDGQVRNNQIPAITFSPVKTEILGRAAGGQIVAEIRLLVHVWAMRDGSETRQGITTAAFMALLDAPETADFWIDEWERPFVSMEDQSPVYADLSHDVIALNAIIRWREG